LTQAIDSASGTITRAYNDVARTVTETSPEGSVTWAADAAGRHAANRRTSKTLPNGIVATYTYDEASLLTGITYRQGATVLGTLWACGADLGGPILPPSLHCDLNL
jgi:YD repeat-containing protein